MTNIELRNDNDLLTIISKVSDHGDVLKMPQLPEILKAMASHEEWEFIKDDAELNQLIREAEEIRHNYTSVSSLRWAYEKVLLRHVHLLCNERGLLLIHRWDNKDSLLLGMTLEVGRDGPKEVYALRVVKNQAETLNHEYHEDLTRNVFDAICLRIRDVDTRSTCFGWLDIESITHPQE